jgi:hypothetical protein
MRIVQKPASIIRPLLIIEEEKKPPSFVDHYCLVLFIKNMYLNLNSLEQKHI